MSATGAVNKNRLQRLEAMLLEKRAGLIDTLERQFGEQLGEDPLAALEETIEIGDRSVSIHGQDIELAVVQMKRDELRQIEGALRRLRSGKYGRCEECDTEIDVARLEILPFAATCVDCKRRREAEERRFETTGRGFRAGFRDIREGGRDEDD